MFELNVCHMMVFTSPDFWVFIEVQQKMYSPF